SKWCANDQLDAGSHPGGGCTERKLGDIGLQVFLAHRTGIRAKQPALQQRDCQIVPVSRGKMRGFRSLLLIFCSTLPYNAKPSANGFDYLKRQLARRRSTVLRVQVPFQEVPPGGRGPSKRSNDQ